MSKIATKIVKDPAVLAARAKQTKEAISQMNPALKLVYERLATNLQAQYKNEVLSRYEVGKEIASVVVDQRKYGQNAAQLLAAALNMSTSLLYNLRTLYNQWKDDYQGLKKITERLTVGGIPLTYSQLLLISQLPDEADRHSIVDRCISECLTVEELKAIIYEKFGKRSNNPGGITPRNPTAGVAVMTKALDRLVEGHSKIQKSVFDKIENKPEDFANDKTVEKIEALVEQINESRKLLAEDERRATATLDILFRHMRTENEADEGDEDDDGGDAPASTPAAKKLKKPATKQTGKVTVVEEKADGSVVDKTPKPSGKTAAKIDSVAARIKAAQMARQKLQPSSRPIGLASV